MKVFQTLQPEQRRNLLFLFVAGLLFWSSLASMLPTLSLYIKDTGASDFEVGVVMGAFAIGLLVFRPWLGRLADQRDRKLVLYIGLAAVAIAPLGYLMTQSIPLLIAVRAFHGLSIAAFATGFSALVADLAPPQSRGEIIGYMTLVNPVGVALGPALGGFLQEWAGYTPLFLVSAGLGIAGILVIHQLHKPPVATQLTQEERSRAEPFWRLLASPRLRIPALVLALIGVAFGTLAIFVPLFIKESGINLNPGLFYTAAAIASFAVRILVGRASDQFGRGRFITGSLVLYTTALALLAIAHSAPIFLLAGFLEGAGGGILLPMMIALAADRSSPQERGRIFGLVLAGFDLGMALAGPLFGYLAFHLGYQGLFSLTAMLSMLALLIFVGFSGKSFAHSLSFSLGRGHDNYALTKGSSS
ncbi:MAG: MFS transporter [Oscillatoriales cyanobacterium C42_A2020_001]|nr:MFS transporter [Leptolyngbyaceae cyanobacterium C42_A2020_001]